MHINCLDLQFKPSYILCIFALRTSVKTKNSEYLWKYFLTVNSYINLRYSFHLSRFFLLHEPMVAMLNYNRITFSGNPRQIIPGGTSLNISCVCFHQIISSSSLIFLLPFLMLASTLYKSSSKCFVPCISWMGMWGTMGIFSFKN